MTGTLHWSVRQLALLMASDYPHEEFASVYVEQGLPVSCR